MDFTDEQLQILHDAGIDPEDLGNDAREINTLMLSTHDIVKTMRPENIGEASLEYLKAANNIAPLAEKYADPRVSKVLEDYASDVLDIDFDDTELADIEDKIDEIEALGQTDPAVQAAIDESYERTAEDMNHLGDGLIEAADRIDQKRADYKALYESNAVDDVVGSVKNDPEFTGALGGLQQLYNRVENIKSEGLTRDEQILVYKDFLSAYEDALNAGDVLDADENEDVTRDSKEIIKDLIDTQIGIPPRVFSDGGAHYTSLLASKVSELMQQAEALEPRGTSKESIAILREKNILMSEARDIVMPTEQGDKPYARNVSQIENEAGYSFGYIADQVVETTDHIDFLRNLENVPSHAETLELETDAPKEAVTPSESQNVVEPLSLTALPPPSVQGAAFKV